MSLVSELVRLASVIGADISNLRVRLSAVEDSAGSGGTNSYVPAVNAATSLIQTQKVMAQMVLRGQVK